MKKLFKLLLCALCVALVLTCFAACGKTYSVTFNAGENDGYVVTVKKGSKALPRVRRRRLCRRLVRQRAKNGRKIRFRQGNHGGRDAVGKVCKHGFQSELRPQLSRLPKPLDGGFYQGRGRNSRAAESGVQISRLERRQRNLRRRLGLRRVGEPFEGRGLFGALGDGDRFGGVFGRHGLCF